jgi:hypothetical protein
MAMTASDRDITHIPTISADRADTFVLVSGIVAGLFLLWALYSLTARRSPVLMLCLIGSVACNLNEPIWDVLGKLRFHSGNHVAWTEFGDLAQPVQYPYWAMLVYTGFAGVACYVFYLVFQTRNWRLFGYCLLGQAVMNIVLEGFVITSAYDYYGSQPWRIGTDFPLWWVPVNYGELLGGALLALAVRRWGVRGSLLAVPIVPCAFSAWQLWAGWPTYATINLDVAGAWRDVAALSGVLIAAGSAWLIGRALLVPEPTGATSAGSTFAAQQSEEHRVGAVPVRP